MSLSARDLVYARRAHKAGARYAVSIVYFARRAGIPLSWAFALVEQESEFRNVFGCDQGSILCHEAVTRDRVERLLAHIRRGGTSNGVGYTQLTSLGLIEQAERYGGAHRVRPQLRVGFEYLAGITDHGKHMELAWHYNGAQAYQRELEAKQQKWHKVLAR